VMGSRPKPMEVRHSVVRSGEDLGNGE
jgi:hypothetical protein